MFKGTQTPTDSAKPSPLDALWQARVIMWVVLAGEGLALVLTLAPGTDRDRWIYFALTSMVIQWVSLTCLGGLYLLRRFLRRLHAQYVAYVALTLLVISTWLVTGCAWLLLRGVWSLTEEGWQTVFLRFTGIALAVGLLGLAAFQNHWRTRQLAVLAKQSELEALQARIRPHFLFNTLNTGAALVHQRPADAEQLLLDLADLFRAALAGPHEIPLEEELALTRRYLEIEALRFGDRLRLLWRLPESLPDARMPTLSMQPLVENAIRHGVEPSADGGVIEIGISSKAGMVDITIRNTLPSRGTLSRSGHNVGLNSVGARIQALTQGRGKLLTTNDGNHFTATILLPADVCTTDTD
ncbi:sensor histidine kinase [Pseudoxanthomonas sacheonensis]|uniref:sensor histidine kinase n=1 Tax=Pseudoxanthomonas sacheonensis TaxID=443615 RepID=UPI0013CFAD62|nr:histidine kinase [Pseudoxanthomonas sacheonensis]KAF1713066.1 histidine kinase [Pseudoxanthomonas sacheonensis]